ncbi:hypothetical protein V6N11_026920 [Hibiscus sabdariffa]|uniref:Protein kish-B n=1 Tax=Hibiscus sabdariffa TaxID=183260 RepID=A0ABR1ZXU9_9ROSI
MSALFNFHSFLTVLLLGICTCTFVRMQFPALFELRTGFRGFFWKAARIGKKGDRIGLLLPFYWQCITTCGTNMRLELQLLKSYYLLKIPPILPATVRTTRKASGKVQCLIKINHWTIQRMQYLQSPTDTKKQLIKVFGERFDDDDPSSKQQLENKPSTTSPHELIPNSACSSGTTPYIGCLPRNEKPVSLSVQCCLPSLGRNMSFGKRKGKAKPCPKLMDGKVQGRHFTLYKPLK